MGTALPVRALLCNVPCRGPCIRPGLPRNQADSGGCSAGQWPPCCRTRADLGRAGPVSPYTPVGDHLYCFACVSSPCKRRCAGRAETLQTSRMTRRVGSSVGYCALAKPALTASQATASKPEQPVPANEACDSVLEPRVPRRAGPHRRVAIWPSVCAQPWAASAYRRPSQPAAVSRCSSCAASHRSMRALVW